MNIVLEKCGGRLARYLAKPASGVPARATCRPVGLSLEEIETVVGFARARVGQTYDLKNIIDLTRYLIRRPPVPDPWKRRMIALGSGDPTKAICSSLIARAFQEVRYPILPEITEEMTGDPLHQRRLREVIHIRHHSLFTPRDFDVSPYFKVIKPTIEHGFDFHSFVWSEEVPEPETGG